MRHTRAHTKNRRSHHALKEPTLSKCSHCGADHRPHHMCLQCGYYNGRQVMDLESKKIKRDARIQSKREAINAQAESADSDESEKVEEDTKEGETKEKK